ncbi:hypothetical protein D3C81_585770 [compost metagenome]
MFQSTLGETLPAETASTADVRNTNWTSGSGARPERSALRLGSTMPASSANNTATGISDQKAARQAPSSAKIPPTAGPTNVATPHMPETSAIARGHRASAKTSRIMA